MMHPPRSPAVHFMAAIVVTVAVIQLPIALGLGPSSIIFEDVDGEIWLGADGVTRIRRANSSVEVSSSLQVEGGLAVAGQDLMSIIDNRVEAAVRTKTRTLTNHARSMFHDCHFNPLRVHGVLTLGNDARRITSDGSTGGWRSAFVSPAVFPELGGVYELEFLLHTENPDPVGTAVTFGLTNNSTHGTGIDIGRNTNKWAGVAFGTDHLNATRLFLNTFEAAPGAAAAYGAPYVAGDRIRMRLDADAGSLTYFVNDVSLGEAAINLPSSGEDTQLFFGISLWRSGNDVEIVHCSATLLGDQGL